MLSYTITREGSTEMHDLYLVLDRNGRGHIRVIGVIPEVET
jgi:hypothetical protein